MDRGAVLGRLARLMAVADAPPQLIDRMNEAIRLLTGGQGSSLSINSGDTARRMTLTATDQVATRLEELQDVLGEGPCHAAYQRNQPVTLDLAGDTDGGWPAFAQSAHELAGDVAVHCFPVRPAGRVFGVFTVYSPQSLTEPTEVVQFLADSIGAAVLTDPALRDHDDVWATKSVIHRATGMVVVQLRVPPDDALAIIRAHAFAHDLTVSETARQIVARRLDFGENA